MKAPHKEGRLGFLFLGGAKRVAMAGLLRKACEARGLECEIYGYELDSHCPLASVGTVYEGLRWSEPAIFGQLDEICERHGIDVVLPFVDGAVGIAAEFVARHSSTGVFCPVSERSRVDAMFDKVASAELFARLGLPIPATYREGAPCGKLIAKPRFGSASKGIIEIDSLSQFYQLRGKLDRYLVQERIDNREEITVDCYVDCLDGHVAACSARLRDEVSGGEVVRTETIDDPDVAALARRTLAATGLRGAVTVQIIRDLDTDRLLIMEINPRLGGGAVASVYAGADIPAMIIANALGEKSGVATATPGVETVRYLADVVFYPEK